MNHQLLLQPEILPRELEGCDAISWAVYTPSKNRFSSLMTGWVCEGAGIIQNQTR